jgi:hypothetical protein
MVIMFAFLLAILIYVLIVVAAILVYSAFLWLSTKILGFYNQDFGTAVRVTVQYAIYSAILSIVLGLLLVISTLFIVIFLGPTIGIILVRSIQFLVQAGVGVYLINKGYDEGMIKSFLAWLITTIAISVLVTIIYLILLVFIGIQINL